MTHKQLQDEFLRHLVEQQVDLSIFLPGGVRLQGRIIGFDQYVLLLEGYGNVQLVYKQAVGAISPHGPVQLWEGAPEKAAKPVRRPRPPADGHGRSEGAVVVERRRLGAPIRRTL
jgi:host factor-I protein